MFSAIMAPVISLGYIRTGLIITSGDPSVILAGGTGSRKSSRASPVIGCIMQPISNCRSGGGCPCVRYRHRAALNGIVTSARTNSKYLPVKHNKLVKLYSRILGAYLLLQEVIIGYNSHRWQQLKHGLQLWCALTAEISKDWGIQRQYQKQ